jgi:hypothetical protein
MSSLDDALNLAKDVACMGDDLHVVVEALIARAAIDVEPRDPSRHRRFSLLVPHVGHMSLVPAAVCMDASPAARGSNQRGLSANRVCSINA